MLKKLIRSVIVILMFIGVLSIGGYTISEFKSTISYKDPNNVFASLITALPDLKTVIIPEDIELPNIPDSTASTIFSMSETTSIDGSTTASSTELDNSNTSTSLIDITTTEESTLFPTTETNKNSSNIEITTIRKIKLTIDGKTIEVSSTSTINFVKWIKDNYNKNSKITYEDLDKADLTYDYILKDEDDLMDLADSIVIVDKLPEFDDYDRSAYEKPTKSYELDGEKYNRNDYSWHISSFLINDDPFEYTCPYTGKTITDSSKLDYDHIVALKSTYLRGAKDWTKEQKNAYAYDQYIGIDVFNSANRSKSDKGPSDWLPEKNKEDYCYSWLIICSKYNLVMTQDELDICVETITKSLNDNIEVSKLGTDLINKDK